MKRDYITGLLPDIDKTVLDQIMAEHGKSVEAQKTASAALTTERDDLKKQLEEANKSIQGFRDLDVEGIKKQAADWEEKHKTETEALTKKLQDMEYGNSVKEAVSGLKFSSEAAKRAFVAEITAKSLPLQDGKLLGLKEYIEEFKAGDASAFAVESAQPIPEIVRGGTGGAPLQTTDESIQAAITQSLFGAP